MTDWKPTRQVDEDYLDTLRDDTCLVCPNRAEPHHLDTVGSGGSDYSAVQLCRRHHSEVHSIGLSAFEDKYEVNLWKEAHRNLRHYIADKPIMK